MGVKATQVVKTECQYCVRVVLNVADTGRSWTGRIVTGNTFCLKTLKGGNNTEVTDTH